MSDPTTEHELPDDVTDITGSAVDDTDAVEEDEHDGLPDELPEQDDLDLDRPAQVPDDEADGFDEPEGEDS